MQDARADTPARSYSEKSSALPEGTLRIALGWLVTPGFLLASFITLCTWHPLIALSRRVSPAAFHEWFIAFGNRVLQYCFYLTGGSITFEGTENLPQRGPLIVVSNHQSLFDIPLLIWLLRGHHAKFIAKRSLGRGIPSASYVLRTNGHALIDRGDATQSGRAIKHVARRARQNEGTVVIFPEGTRARDGSPRQFKPGGLKILLQELPSAPVVPISINGAWRIMRHRFLPVPFGIGVRCTVLPAVPRTENSTEQEIIDQCEQAIRRSLPC